MMINNTIDQMNINPLIESYKGGGSCKTSKPKILKQKSEQKNATNCYYYFCSNLVS